MNRHTYNRSDTFAAAFGALLLATVSGIAQDFSIDFEEYAVGTLWNRDSSTLEEDGVSMLCLGGYEGEDPGMRITSDNRAGHSGNELFVEIAALAFPELNAVNLSFHYGSAGDSAPAFGRLIVNGVATPLGWISALDGETVGGVTVSVTSQAVGFGDRGVVSLQGSVQSLTIDAFLTLDHIVGSRTQTPAPLPAELKILSAAAISETEREVLFEARAPANASLTLQKSADLGSVDPWTEVGDAQITPRNRQSEVWDITAIVPANEPQNFFRLSAQTAPAQ